LTNDKTNILSIKS